MKLFTYFRSSAAFRVRIALNLKGIDYEPSFVHLVKGEQLKGDFAKLNPQLLVPALDDAGLLVSQSLAIMEYLEEKYPKPALLPADAAGRARVRALSLFVACEIHPLNNLRTLKYLRSGFGFTEDQIETWYRHWIADGLEKLETSLGQSGDTGAFSHGATPTMADCFLVPQIFNAQRYKCNLAPFPTVMRVFDRCMTQEAFRKAQPAQQPDRE